MRDGLQINVLLDSPTPVYRQVVDQLRALCVDGRLVPGARLPSVRELAGRLAVHFNTIADAYRVLAEEGWVAIEHGRGVTVLDRRTPRAPAAAAQAGHSSRLRHLVAELRGLGMDAEWIRREVNAALGGKS